MGALSLADALTDFGRPVERDSGFAGIGGLDDTIFDLPELAAGDADIPLPAPGPDVEALVAEAAAAARAEAEDRLARELGEAIEAERARHAAEIEELRARTGDEIGAALGERFQALEASLLDMTATVVGRVLAPVLSDELARRSVERLAELLRDALGDGDAVRVRVRGPQSLLAALESRLGERAAGIAFTETTGFDLAVDIDESLYETRLAEWSASISEAMGQT